MKKPIARSLLSTVRISGAGTWWSTKPGRKPNAPVAAVDAADTVVVVVVAAEAVGVIAAVAVVVVVVAAAVAVTVVVVGIAVAAAIAVIAGSFLAPLFRSCFFVRDGLRLEYLLFTLLQALSRTLPQIFAPVRSAFIHRPK
jgi:hypothetical protein